MKIWVLLAFLLGFCTSVLAQGTQKKVVCYLMASSYQEGFRLNESSYVPCTHIIYSFARIDQIESSVHIDPSDREGLEDLRKYRDSRRLNSSTPLDMMIQIGGDDDADKYSDVTSSPSKRRLFIQSIMSLSNTYSFDGVDLHWKWPGRRTPPEKRNYVSFTQELRSTITETNSSMLISMILPSQRSLIIPGYNLLFLNAVVDFFSLPAFNFTMDAPPHTYHHSPLNNPPEANITDNSLISIARLYLRLGVVAERLILGIPLFGRLVNTNTMEIENYQLPFNQICQMLADGEWTKAGDSVAGPLRQKDDEIISLDTLNSIEEKSKLANILRLGGVMFWSMDMDDWNGSCPKSDTSDFGNSSFWPNIEAAAKVLTPLETLTDVVANVSYGGYGGGSAYSATVFGTEKPTPARYPSGLGSGSAAGGSSYYTSSGAQSVSGGSLSGGYPSNAPDSGYYPAPGNFPFSQSHLPTFRIIEAGQDILIEDTQVQINENHYLPNPRS